MNCPCEVLVDSTDQTLAESLLQKAEEEAARIENKFSRYKKENLMDEINSSAGRAITVDAECAALLDYAAQCYSLSEGLFDITTGVLRKAWTFDGRSATANEAVLKDAREHLGWNRVQWKNPALTLPIGFQIDFGGICKEYAADKILALLRTETNTSVLVNMGGDIAAAGSHSWAVGIEDPRSPGKMLATVALARGGIATSGATKRFTKVGQQSLSHILNPKTGWPVENPPLSVTVHASSCTEAGLWSTLGMLHGADAEKFLKEAQVQHWSVRP